MRSRDLRMLEEPEVAAFWDEAHQRNAHLWLTGSDPSEVLERLGVSSEILQASTHSENAKVLDVGVGEGLMSNFLTRHNLYHDCLDISANALTKVGNTCRNTFLDASDLVSETYDLIMHHLVAQHMSHSNLTDQLRHLVRSLRSDGMLRLQYSTTSQLILEGDDSENQQKTGAVNRNPEWFRSAVNDLPEATIVSDTQTDDFGGICFRVVCIQKS